MMSNAQNLTFADCVVRWQIEYGRNNLPWQNTREPYKVWLSEIMLQQTQVATVKNYFQKFISQLPDVSALALASEDEVMGLWSGLGYYSRARNLHRCAKIVMSDYGGQFPNNAQALAMLPGIGRSTASAIASVCFGERVAILDANVKRVLTRILAFEGDLALTKQERTLWDAATSLLPAGSEASTSMPRYTQGMMDLGATVCSVKQPVCTNCPVQTYCQAYKNNNVHQYPVRTRKLKRSSQAIWLLLAQSRQGSVWLTKRPSPGVWAGLQCLPLFDNEQALYNAVPRGLHHQLQALPAFTHVLTHKDLHLHPIFLELPDGQQHWPEGQWFTRTEWTVAGLPAPIRKLLLEHQFLDGV